MPGADTLSDALQFAIDRSEMIKHPRCVLNAHNDTFDTYIRQSNNACYNLKNTIEGVFNTILIRATRQTDETLGLVALAAAHTELQSKILIAQENIHGAPGLEKTLRRAFPNLQTLSKFKCRIMILDARDGDAEMLSRWSERAAVQKVKHNRGEFWSAPGIFSWDRPDPGSRLLLDHLPASMPGNIADLGCGNGLLSEYLAKKDSVAGLYCIDSDSRAVECCRLNLQERDVKIPFQVTWSDATQPQPDWPQMDFVVMNPPFHTQQDEDRELGQKFCQSALKMLKPGGKLYLVANRHLPYETFLKNPVVLGDTDGFKILCAGA